jgi:hypothetical protein
MARRRRRCREGRTGIGRNGRLAASDTSGCRGCISPADPSVTRGAAPWPCPTPCGITLCSELSNGIAPRPGVALKRPEALMAADGHGQRQRDVVFGEVCQRGVAQLMEGVTGVLLEEFRSAPVRQPGAAGVRADVVAGELEPGGAVGDEQWCCQTSIDPAWQQLGCRRWSLAPPSPTALPPLLGSPRHRAVCAVESCGEPFERLAI